MHKDARLLKVGVLGAGPIAQFAHFDACRKARNAELYAICDTAEDLLHRMAAVHQPTVTYRDYDAMLADPLVEAVIIATADQFHVPLALRAVQAGKPVLVEKPLGVNIEECAALAQAVHTAGVWLQVATMKRFDPGIAFARRFIQDELGGLLALKAWYCDSTARYSMTDNLQPIPVVSAQARRPLGDPKHNRRRYLMLAHGSHLVDTARFLGGDIVSVHAHLLEKFDAHCWFVEVEFASGALGHLDLTIPIQGDFEEGFRIYGEYGSINGRTYLPWFHKASDVECFSAKDGQYHRPLGADAYTYKLQIEALADRVLHGIETQAASVDDGLAVVRTLVAIARSVETGAPQQPHTASGAV